MDKRKPIAPRGRPIAEELALLEQHRPLVMRIASGIKRKLPRNILHEDLVAAGMGGLWSAILRYTGKTEEFAWYARVRIRGAIFDELRAQDWLPRRAREAAEAASGTDAYVPPPTVVRFDEMSEWEQTRALTDISDSEATVATNERLETIQRVIDLLPERERYIVSRHYFRGDRFKDLGQEFGITVPRVSQLHTRAINRLRSYLTGAPLPPRRDSKPKRERRGG